MKIQVQDQNHCGIGQARIESYYLLGFVHIRHHHRSLPTVPKHCGRFYKLSSKNHDFFMSEFVLFPSPEICFFCAVNPSTINFSKNHLTMVQDCLKFLGLFLTNQPSLISNFYPLISNVVVLF